jgi:hypothetical protein
MGRCVVEETVGLNTEVAEHAGLRRGSNASEFGRGGGIKAERDWGDRDESMREGSMDLHYCQGLLLSGIIRMERWKPRVYKELAGVNCFDNGMEKYGEASA